MPELLAYPLLTAAYAGSVGPVLATLTVGNLLSTGVVVASSPAECLTLGKLAGIGAPPRDPPPRRRVLARELGIAGDFGPNAYVGTTAGDCLAPSLPDGVPLLIDPDATPRPGDVVIIWPRTDCHLAVGNGRMTMLSDAEVRDPDPVARDVLDGLGRPLVASGSWCFAKILAAPLPPRDQWADDCHHRLVVRMTRPEVELRANLRDVLSVDRVIAPVRCPDMPPAVAAAVDAWRGAVRSSSCDS